MIRMTQLKVEAARVTAVALPDDLRHGIVSKEEEACIREKISGLMDIPSEDIHELTVEKKSIDARHKDNILFVYTVTFKAIREHRLVNKYGRKDACVVPEKREVEENSIMKDVALQIALGRRPKYRPVVVGTGPAGLFAAVGIAEAGLSPIVIERGSEMKARRQKVQDFWDGKAQLDPETNVQFGEGGAGTFSDGKLNTGVKDPDGKIKYILETFANYGAPSQILYEAKPHVGTDRLVDVVLAMRERIIALGGDIFFNTRFDYPIIDEDHNLTGIMVTQDDQQIKIDCESLVLATGHSARDTFRSLMTSGMQIVSKPFSVGVRVQHDQNLIGYDQYGDMYSKLPPASYRLAHTTAEGRGVYSFCMCPGGYVVNASSVSGYTVVNGMSYYDRDSGAANSAIVVTVNSADFGSDDPMAGIEYQETIERLAYRSAEGKIPVQLFGDFMKNQVSTGLGRISPVTRGAWKFANLRTVLPENINLSLATGIMAFENKIKGYSAEDTLLMGVETRTSSPVRMLRDKEFQSNIRGIYPCGEGAGYAGGIVSAAMDGMKVAERIVETTELE